MGNIIGRIGHGKHLIAMDAHIDTVGIGDIKNWTFDPYLGKEDDACVYGRGGSDQEGGMASMVYAAKIINDLDLKGDYTLLVTGTVQEAIRAGADAVSFHINVGSNYEPDQITQLSEVRHEVAEAEGGVDVFRVERGEDDVRHARACRDRPHARAGGARRIAGKGDLFSFAPGCENARRPGRRAA